MSKKIQLTIAKPCHENWDAMSDVQKGKFCDSCQKQVVDFTNMSDRQLAEFFKKPSTGSVCGRFMSDQLERELEIPKKRIPWLKYFFTIAIPAFFASKVSAQQQPKTMGKVLKPAISKPIQTAPLPEIKMLGEVAPIEITIVKKDTAVLPEAIRGITVLEMGKVSNAYCNEQEYDSRNRTISGVVTDESGQPVAGASVIVKGTIRGCAANEKGAYKILARTGDILKISAIGFKAKEVAIGVQNLIPISLEAYTLEEVVVTGYTTKTTCTISMMGAVSVVKGKVIEKKIEEEKEVKYKSTSLKIYPNPVQSAQPVSIAITNATEGYYTYQLTSLSGQSIHQQEIWIDKTAKVLSLDIPAITAGAYLLTLIHKKTNHKFSEKIVVQ